MIHCNQGWPSETIRNQIHTLECSLSDIRPTSSSFPFDFTEEISSFDSASACFDPFLGFSEGHHTSNPLSENLRDNLFIPPIFNPNSSNLSNFSSYEPFISPSSYENFDNRLKGNPPRVPPNVASKLPPFNSPSAYGVAPYNLIDANSNEPWLNNSEFPTRFHSSHKLTKAKPRALVSTAQSNSNNPSRTLNLNSTKLPFKNELITYDEYKYSHSKNPRYPQQRFYPKSHSLYQITDSWGLYKKPKTNTLEKDYASEYDLLKDIKRENNDTTFTDLDRRCMKRAFSFNSEPVAHTPKIRDKLTCIGLYNSLDPTKSNNLTLQQATLNNQAYDFVPETWLYSPIILKILNRERRTHWN